MAAPQRATAGRQARRAARRLVIFPSMSRALRTTLLLLASAGLLVLVGSALVRWLPGTGGQVDDPLLSPAAKRVTVDVRNAGGVDGMARAATGHLRSAGFDVVGMGNARRMDLDSSVVIDRVGDLQAAAGVAEALGIARVASQPDSNLFVDVTVQLGADWRVERAEPPERRSALDWLRDLVGSR